MPTKVQQELTLESPNNKNYEFGILLCMNKNSVWQF